jgi:glucosylceramidase
MKNLTVIVCLLGMVSCGGRVSVKEWVTSTFDASWEKRDAGTVKIVTGDVRDAEIDLLNPQQSIEGFGSCFNELGWTSLCALSEADRESVMRELFAPGVGGCFTVCRMPVAANDFSRNWYSYNETAGDFEMKNFSIANDRETLIPFIKNALRYNPELKIWASPWCPPSWMKHNRHYACAASPEYNDIRPEQLGREGTDMFICDDAHFKAYALYFAKFIEAYRNENIRISMVMPQNEFNSCQTFPSCTWTAAGLNRFVGQYLGPEMRKLGVELMLGTMERPNPLLVDTLLKDMRSGEYISGVGFQWAGKDAVGTVHRNYPQLSLYQTEQECGDGRNDRAHCLHAWELMKHYLNSGVNVYEYWNTSLEEGGMSRWGWRQNSLVTVDAGEKTFKFTFEYYLIKHFSHYIQKGARFLPVADSSGNVLAFLNPDGTAVIVAYNGKLTESTRIIGIGEHALSLTLKPDSFNTIVVKL